ncbi:MAG TPA: ABC transporter ATP-binding protein [Gemmatimonadaceae bacterium]|nr:ABC transporter ATP-binding protein [Gemmatimonadaceae bacterium]
MSDILAVRDLIVRFPNFTLGPLAFTVASGDIVALLGANAAGKTTLLRAITGRLLKREGAVELLGRDPRQAPDAWRANVGFAAEKPPAEPTLRVREWFAFLADCYSTWDRSYQEELTRRLGLDAAEKIGALSRGTAVKAAYVSAEAYRPALLVLDEPTNGLDPVVRIELLGLLRETFTGSRDRALLFSSHLLEDVESLCDRALLLRRGQLVAELAGHQLTESRASGTMTSLVADVLREPNQEVA